MGAYPVLSKDGCVLRALSFCVLKIS